MTRPTWNPRPIAPARRGPQERASRPAAEAVSVALAPPVDANGVPRLALSLEEAAEALSVSRRHLEALLASGELPSVRLGDRRLVPVDSLRRHLLDLAERQGGP